MRYLSVCSGIEAATVAWKPLGWQAAAFSEIEAFPRAVLAHHYPNVPLHGDFITIEGGEYGSVDVLVGGTPCQDFSLAGLRAGITGDRGNLTLEFLRLAARARPRWIVWENVPGVLSSDEGRALGAFLGGLGQLGYGFAYRVFDAQYFALAQRRARVFVVGCLGDWRRAGAVLFEREGLRWDLAPSREAQKDVAGTITAGAFTGGAGGRVDGAIGGHFPIAHTLRAEGFDASEDGTGRGIPLTVATLDASYGRLQGASGQDANHGHSHLVAFTAKDYGADAGPLAPTLRAGGYTTSHANGGIMPAISTEAAVRRLTPRECERLQGFPDDYTRIQVRKKVAADGPRYKALGNSMAVPVMRWIGERIAKIEAMS